MDRQGRPPGGRGSTFSGGEAAREATALPLCTGFYVSVSTQGPAPKPSRRRRNVPARGEWHSSAGIGWQHGSIPDPPDGLREPTLKAWRAWFSAWYAANWIPEDVPNLRLIAMMYDAIERGVSIRAADRTALHTWQRSYGMTPDGQSALRWLPPKEREEAPASKAPSRYAHLKVVSE
jgi:hypothetical protein